MARQTTSLPRYWQRKDTASKLIPGRSAVLCKLFGSVIFIMWLFLSYLVRKLLHHLRSDLALIFVLFEYFVKRSFLV